MSASIVRGNALALPLADATVDIILTSPPYFALRSYTDNGEHYAGQLGSEPTPAEYVDALIAATREMVRVLKPSGSIWVNLGDKYANDAKWGGATGGKHVEGLHGATGIGRVRMSTGIPAKSLMGIPWRYALRCIDDLGLILRAEVIWCLSGGAKVYARTASGDRPIMLRDLVRAYRPEQVQLWNGQQWTRVRGWNRTPDDAGALELELRTGERIGCTPGHRWPTRRGVIRADEIRVGDVIETTRLPEPDEPRTPALLPDDDIGWLVGLYIAEGSRSERTVQIAGHINEAARHARLTRIATALDGRAAVYQTSANGSTCNLSGAAVLGVIDRYVSPGTAKTKRLRLSVWQRSNRFLSAILDGYLSGDGHYDAKNDRWRLGFTANDEWASDLRTIAARLGIVLKLRRGVHIMAGRSFPGWRGEIRYTRSVHHNAKQDGEVVAIRSSRARDFYDLGVADDPHLFALASGVLTHNSKPNGLPESVTDRVRRSHEQWFHFTREPRYYSAVDEIRDSYAPATAARYAAGYNARAVDKERPSVNTKLGGDTYGENPLGKLPGSVWTIPTQPLTVPPELGVDHFAAFPMEWPRRLILGWSPPGICTVCGDGRRPVVLKSLRLDHVQSRTTSGLRDLSEPDSNGRGINAKTPTPNGSTEATITGYACACPTPDAPTRPSVILDPFGGTGTTALIAGVLGRTGVSLDMSADYCRLARWRTTDPAQRAAAMQVEKPAPVAAGQAELFTEATP